jgi:membrane protease YdiL (CAAX protease family)
MQTTTPLTTPRSTQGIAFLFYLTGGLLIFMLGANTFDVYATNRNALYEWGLTMLLLLLAVSMHRSAPLRIYARIADGLFIAAAANAINLSLGNFLKPLFSVYSSEMQFLAVDKLSQAIPIVAAIVLLTLWSGDDLGALFLKKGNLRQGLIFGLISFAIFAGIFIVIVLIQTGAPKTQGLFASGVSLSTVVAAIPWILLFCFANSFMEELWFRGVALRKLTPLLGWAAATIVTALVFGISHSAATYITSVQMIFFPIIVIVLGLVNAHVMLKTDSIWGSVFFHAGYDLLVILPLLSAAE